MSFTARFALLLGAILAATVVAAPPFKLLLDALLEAWPGLAELLHLRMRDGVYDFGRVHRRLFMLVALLAVALAWRRLGRVPLLGTGRGEARWRMLGAGAAAGLVSWAAFQGVLLLAGSRELAPAAAAEWPQVLAAALLTAAGVSLLEETVLRGWLLGGLARELPRIAAVLASSALYSALHFMRAEVPLRRGEVSATVGLETLAAHLRPLLDPAALGGFVGLTLVGVVLAYAYLWSRSLPFAIGVHAGWVLLIRCDGLWFGAALGQRGIYGPDGLLAGPWGWLFLAGVLAAMRPLARRLAARREGR